MLQCWVGLATSAAFFHSVLALPYSHFLHTGRALMSSSYRFPTFLPTDFHRSSTVFVTLSNNICTELGLDSLNIHYIWSRIVCQNVRKTAVAVWIRPWKQFCDASCFWPTCRYCLLFQVLKSMAKRQPTSRPSSRPRTSQQPKKSTATWRAPLTRTTFSSCSTQSRTSSSPTTCATAASTKPQTQTLAEK